MAFSFGAKPASTGGFGGFGAATTAQPAATGGFGGFGAAATATPAVGQPSTGFGGFGAAAAPAAGQQQPAATGGFGGFGASNAAATSQPSTGFGGFGAATSQPSTGFGGFGATTTQATNTGGFGGFGAAKTQASTTGFGGFGAATTAQPQTGFGGFGAANKPAAATGFGGFGSTAATSTANTGFGGFGSTTSQPSAFGGFGSSTTTTQSNTGGFGGFGSFGGNSANKPATLGGFGSGGGGGLFGGTGGTSLFGGQNQQQQLQQQQHQKQNPVDELFNSVLHCSLFGDERDGIIARWNMLQASWGVGKAYYSNNAQPITISPENPFSRFKAIGYSALPKHEDKEGLVCLVFKKKLAELEAGRSAIITSLSGIMGNKPTVKVTINTIKSTGPDTNEVVITVEESAPTGAIRKVPATELNTFFNQPAQVQNLKNMGVEMVIPKVEITETDLKDYLSRAPVGVDPRLWKQAQLDNPNPKKFIPVPIIGFKSLQQRIKVQENQAKSHQGRLDCIADDISSLQKKHQNTLAALAEAKRRQLELSHRVLKVLVNQESTRKYGFTITQEEEQLRSQLESIQAELETPTQFKGKLNELLSQVRLQSQSMALSGTEKYTLDQFAVADIKCVLKDQQQAIQALVQVVKDDLKDLNVMVDGLSNAAG